MATALGADEVVGIDSPSTAASAQDLADMMILGALQKGGSPALFGFDADGRLLGCVPPHAPSVGTISSTTPQGGARPGFSPTGGGHFAHASHAHAQRIAPYPLLSHHLHHHNAPQVHVPAPAGWPHVGAPSPSCAFPHMPAMPMAGMPLMPPHVSLGSGTAVANARPAPAELHEHQHPYQHQHQHQLFAQPLPQHLPAPPPHVAGAPYLVRTTSAPQLGAHAAPARRRASSSASDRRFMCPYCKMASFSAKDELTTHIKACGLSYACSCSLRFQTRAKLLRHCRRCGHDPWQPGPGSSATEPWPASTPAGSFSSGVESDMTTPPAAGRALSMADARSVAVSHSDGGSLSRGAGGCDAGSLLEADDKSYASLGAEAERPVWAVPAGAAAVERAPSLRHLTAVASAAPALPHATPMPMPAQADELTELLSFLEHGSKHGGGDEFQDANDLLSILHDF
ncbi:hypothetical protein KFE25_002974 [Diacronema lutheri]|uniref:Uncharacterized protein n=2 Tax=Diacronema lutheri TaxID=2081491 RepID=A0A8J6C8S8_DIALT|nr:hypothetical protein KFE25_002974 [Diacronema lutheri]